MSKTLPLITAGLLAGIGAWAQQDSIPSKALEEVIITANKFPQKQTTTGKVISVITKEQIEKSAAKTLGQLLNEQAGITVNGALNNAGTNQSLYLRGAASGRTLILLDGIPVYDPSLSGSEFDLNLMALNPVESIEICRGAQSTLYGSDALAGVVNIITAKPNSSRPLRVKATLSGGSYGTLKSGVQLSGGQGKLSYTAGHSRIRTDGFSSAHDSTGKQSFDHDGYSGSLTRAVVKYQLSPSFAVKSFVQYSQTKTELDAGAFMDERDYFFTNKALLTGGGIQYSKEGVSLSVNYQHSNHRRNYLNDSVHVAGFTTFSTDTYSGSTEYIEGHANINLGSGFRLLQGADYRYSSMKSRYNSLSAFGPYTSEFKDTAHSQASLYGSLFYSGPGENLNVDLGGRINVHSRYGRHATFSFNPSYHISEQYRLFGSVASAFKAPTLYQLYSAYGNQLLKPERSTTYEFGLEQQHTGFSNRMVYFRRKISGGLDFDYISYQYFNINRQTVNGMEWESRIAPIQSLLITINYTYLNPREQSQSRITFRDTTYTHLLRRPRHQVNVNGGYSFGGGLYLSVGAKYVSRRYDMGGYQKEDVPLEDYLLLNAYTEYKFKKWIKLFVDAQNLTNRKFYDVGGYNSIPFLVQAGITFQW
jgi:vitamin B12 transporter